MVHNHKPAWHSGQFGPVWESWIRVNSELIRLFCEHLTLLKVLLIFGVLLSIWLLTLASNWSKSLKCPNHRGNLGRPEKVEIFVNYRVNLTILCILILNLIYIIWLILSLFKWFLVSQLSILRRPKLPRCVAQIAPVSRISGAIWAIAVFALVSKPLAGKHFFSRKSFLDSCAWTLDTNKEKNTYVRT